MVTSCHPDEDVSDNPKHPDFCERKYWHKIAGETWDDPRFLSGVGYEVWHMRHINPIFRLNEAVRYPVLKFVRDYIDAQLNGDEAKELEACADEGHDFDIRDYSWLEEYLPKGTRSSYWG